MIDPAEPDSHAPSSRLTANGFVAGLALPPAKAVMAVAIGAAMGLLSLMRTENPLPVASILLALALAWSAMIDVDRYRLPDLLTLPMIVCGLLYWMLVDPSQAPQHLIGAAAGYFSLLLVAEAYRLLRKRDGLGRGDAKLLAAAGAWLGWKALPFVVLGGSVGALLLVAMLAALRGREVLTRPVPFGPFLAAAFWVGWLVRPWPSG